MATLTNFGEQFASKVLKKTYANSVMQAIVNRDYEGEIKKPGDRVNILSFLNDVLFSDYTVGSDMNSETIVDAEDVLIVEKRKYSNFSLDRLEDLFTYGSDVPSQLLDNTAKVLERLVDEYVLDKACEAAPQNWVGVNLLIIGDAVNTMASLTTTATGGTITINGNFTAGNFGHAENALDGSLYFGGFEAADVGKGIRLGSTRTFVSPWYKISAVTDSVSASITEWDGAVSGSDFAEGYTLRGIFGGDGKNFPKNGAGDQTSLVAVSGLSWEFQAAIATAISSTSIYNQVTLLAEKLDEAEVADTGRHLVVPPAIQTQLRQSSALQPTGIAELYLGTVVNGRVMRVGAFDVHVAVGSRVSTRAGHSTATDGTTTTGATGYQIPALHTAMITYADKWSESRVVDAENQFAKKYQGLYLFGAKVPAYRRKYGAILFGNF